MLQNLLERLQETYRRYRRPAFVLLIDGILYNLLGGVTAECSRCPMPPMNGWQKFLFLSSGVVMYVCVIWMFLIHCSRRTGRD